MDIVIILVLLFKKGSFTLKCSFLEKLSSLLIIQHIKQKENVLIIELNVTDHLIALKVTIVLFHSDSIN